MAFKQGDRWIPRNPTARDVPTRNNGERPMARDVAARKNGDGGAGLRASAVVLRHGTAAAVGHGA